MSQSEQLSTASSPSLARRLAHLQGIDLSEEDLQSILAEFEEYDAALAQLEGFAHRVAWLDHHANGAPE